MNDEWLSETRWATTRLHMIEIEVRCRPSLKPSRSVMIIAVWFTMHNKLSHHKHPHNYRNHPAHSHDAVCKSECISSAAATPTPFGHRPLPGSPWSSNPSTAPEQKEHCQPEQHWGISWQIFGKMDSLDSLRRDLYENVAKPDHSCEDTEKLKRAFESINLFLNWLNF